MIGMAQTHHGQLYPLKPTAVYDTFWRFAYERQEVFFRRIEGFSPPWTEDSILIRYKFTNVYRASDKVSQYLIKNIIYSGDQSPEEVFFRTMLFKIFNRIETWELLRQSLGLLTYEDWSFDEYDMVLTDALASGIRIFSAAYIMPSGESSFGSPRKHRNCLLLLERMMQDELPSQVQQARSMREVFELLRSYPMLGDFLAYQYAIDINYSELTNFSEMDFVVPGPGARDGISKCFSEFGGLNGADIVRLIAERQDEEFRRLGLPFRSLWGRPLQLIDCQNLFCEVSKYARIAHPEAKGISERVRIKQKYHPGAPLEYWYPPKWGINQHIKNRSEDLNDVSL